MLAKIRAATLTGVVVRVLQAIVAKKTKSNLYVGRDAMGTLVGMKEKLFRVADAVRSDLGAY